MDQITVDLWTVGLRTPHMSLSRRHLPLAGTLAVILAGCGSSSQPSSSTASVALGHSATSRSATSRSSAPAGASPAAARSARVVISGFAFHPATVTVVSGARVTFVNRDPTNHTATAQGGGFDTRTVAPGATKTVILKKPGTYTYFCQFHAFMKATVVVR